MNILTVENIVKSFGERKLFDHTSFYLQEGEKVGVIGINGTGKSTLLKIIAGLEETDEGNVIRANHVICSYLPQQPEFEEEENVLQAVLKRAKINLAESREHAEAWTQESDVKAMLMQIGVTDFTAQCGTLSGGQRKRLALAAALLSPADILILDEPTNHLDNEMADWLEEMLKKRSGAIVMVTHDRYFLDSVSNRIVEIDKGQIYSYQANYSGYLELKAMREEEAFASERKRQSILRTELEWVRRGARARSTKQKARLERYEELKQAAAPAYDAKVEMNSVASRLGKTTVEMSHISKSYGEKILINDFSYLFLKQDRIGFIGANGCGKTTLMKILTGECKPDEGSIEIGQTVKIGYYSQEIAGLEMPPNKKVIDYIRDVAEYIKTEDGSITASQMLERFLFFGSEQYTVLGKLSGGEKRRLNLLKVLMGAPNVLILDEPTNDLDITTLTVLEDYLDHFPGIVITVSHDRYFLDRTVRRIFAFEDNGRIRQYEGGYTDYAQKKEATNAGEMLEGNDGNVSRKGEKGNQAGNTDGKKNWKMPSSKLRFTYQEQRDYDTIESEITKLEERVEALEAEIVRASTDFIKLNELAKEKKEIEHKLEEKMNRWMYLEDLKDKIDKQ
ncbi:MAG: ABC-F family ATP-binding cassette domain-containing protein [Clostridiales bacterium]|mgnify:CR=1 FL=1|nr:ABC-F family ATP-binding cassette domain-containing protein [Clostridiales bacterium]